MLALRDIREWVAGFGISEDSHVYIGKLDNKKERSIGVYRRKGSGPPVMALGGALQSSYDVRRISLLVHWERDPVRSEAAAMELFERIRKESDKPDLEVGDTRIFLVSLQVPEPQDVGTDESGIYEYVIWLDLYYERKRGMGYE